MVGLDPAPYTLRQLVWLAESRQETDWNHTAAILAMLHNTHCRRNQTVSADQFHPLRKRRRPTGQLTPQQSITYLSANLVH